MRAILFYCEAGDHLVSRAEAEYSSDGAYCPRHAGRDGEQVELGEVAQ
jgi:hypothetical protein